MLKKFRVLLVVFGVFFLGGFAESQDQKKRSGTVIGVVKSSKPSPNGKNTILEVQAPGEEKARPYRVLYDPKVKGPNPAVLEAVRKSKVGDRVQVDWVDTGEGLAIQEFHILKKSGDKKSDQKPEEAKKTSTVIGELKSRAETKDGKNSIIEVLAPGEEKARSYHVMYDQKIKGPNPKVLESVRAAKIGDRVELDWVSTNHGPAITAFKIFPKGK